MEKVKTKIINGADFGLEPAKSQPIEKGIAQIREEKQVLIDAYNDVIELEIIPENLKKFKELRLMIRDNRTKGIEPWHKKSKAYFLAGGRFVDAIKNQEIEENKRMEETLANAENYFINLEKERIEKLHNERFELIKPYLSEEDLESPTQYGNMTNGVWDAFFVGVKDQHQERLDAEKKKAEEEEAERQRVAKLEKDNKALIQEKEEKIQEEKQEQERIANQGDEDKMADLVKDIHALKTKYNFESPEFQKKYRGFKLLADKTIQYLNKK